MIFVWFDFFLKCKKFWSLFLCDLVIVPNTQMELAISSIVNIKGKKLYSMSYEMETA